MSKNKRGRELVKNTFIISLGTFLPKIMALITLPLLTGMLSKEEYGTYDFIIILVSLLLPTLTLQIQTAAFRYLIDCRNDKKKTDTIITNVIIFVIAISFIGLVAIFFIINRVEIYTRIVVLIYYFLDIIYLVLQQIIRGIGKNFNYSMISICNAIMSTILMIIFLFYTKLGLTGVIISLAISNFVCVILAIISSNIIKNIDVKLLSLVEIKKLLKYSWPMVPNNLSGWVLSLSDRIIITYFVGIEANAVYAVANKFPNLLNTAKSTFIYAWQENASIALNDDDRNDYYTLI